MEMRAHAHPQLLTALKRLNTYEDYIEKQSPISKRSGLFFFSTADLPRPEIVHYRRQLREHYNPPETAKILLLLPQTSTKPFHKAREIRRIQEVIQNLGSEVQRGVHVCVYAAPFGVIPLELDEIYPLSQHETVFPIDKEVSEYVAEQVSDYVRNSEYKSVVLLHDPANWGNTAKAALKKACLAKKVPLEYLNLKVKGQKTILTRLEIILNKNLREQL